MAGLEDDIEPDELEDMVALGLIADTDVEDEQFMRANVEFSQLDLARKHFDDTLGAIAAAAFLKGTNIGRVRESVRERYGVLRRRARTISEDQSEKFDAALERKLYVAAGVKEGAWTTMQDDKVRDHHENLEGQIFDMEGPGDPEDGHPGDAVNCRCWYTPVAPR